ncbi:MAG TPA: serine/threonine-protein kinase [Polyangiaceae bacterium]|jgi:serine/threonine-protein kinase
MSAVLSAAANRLPRTFGRYALFDFIGKGGMAEIYLARQKTELGATRLCVVKQILPGLAGDPRFSEMLVHEAKLAARLNHANVVQVFDLGREDERLFIAMEYVEGFDLNDLLRRCSRAKVPLPFELAVHVVREALRGLDYAHRRMDDDGKSLGIVHRDVSPSNLLVSFDGEVKVCDFGIARANDMIAGGAAAHELDEAIRGKAGYMSPEHARGEPIDARADVFAAGIVLWELAAGRRLYKGGEGRDALIEQARRGEVPDLPSQGLPQEAKLQTIARMALARDRGTRFASAAAMLRELEAYAASARLMTSPLQLGDWLEKTFGEEILARRRARERAVAALEKGAPLVVQPIQPIAPAPAPVHAPTAAPSEGFGPIDLDRSSSQLPPAPVSAPTFPTPLAIAPRQRPRSRLPLVAILLVLVVALAATVIVLLRRG